MAGHDKITKRGITQLFATFVVFLLILLAGFFLYHYFFPNKANRYLINNKYYGFKLQTPKNWVAREKTFYSENNISQIIEECKKDKLNDAPVYEIGMFRFENQRYPEGFGDPGYLPNGFPSGIILEIIINCVPEGIKNKIGDYASVGLKIDGEKTLESFLDSLEFGKTRQLSFLHNNFQYIVSEYIYISSEDIVKEEEFRKNYAEVFDKIISSFEFVK